MEIRVLKLQVQELMYQLIKTSDLNLETGQEKLVKYSITETGYTSKVVLTVLNLETVVVLTGGL